MIDEPDTWDDLPWVEQCDDMMRGKIAWAVEMAEFGLLEDEILEIMGLTEESSEFI